MSVDYRSLWPKENPCNSLSGVTAEDVGQETAVALNLPDVVSELEAFFRRFVVMPDAAYLALATWAVATYLPDAFDCFPYVALLSPAKRCGKTRVLELLELVCAGAWRGTSPTAAALYRMMEKIPTLLLDEVEALRGRNVSESNQAILAVLNAGHRKGATVPRCDGPKNELKQFPVYGPKVFAAIGQLPDTLADRSIRITMQRKLPGQKVERFLQSRAQRETEPIRERLIAWAESRQDTVRQSYEQTPDLLFIEDRDADLWMPLFAVCAVAAPERLPELRICAQTLTDAKAGDDVEDSYPLKLLADVQSVWSGGPPHMVTVSLLEALKTLPESPWGDYGKDGLNARSLAKMLRQFGIQSRTVRSSASETAKGYQRADFEHAFSRYLPSGGNLSVTPSQPA